MATDESKKGAKNLELRAGVHARKQPAANARTTMARRLTPMDLAAAENALARLDSRKDETVQTWAERLGADLSLHRD